MLPSLERGQMYCMSVHYGFNVTHLMHRELRLRWLYDHFQIFHHQTGVEPNRLILRGLDPATGEGCLELRYIPGGGDLQILRPVKKTDPYVRAYQELTELVARIQRSRPLADPAPAATPDPLR